MMWVYVVVSVCSPAGVVCVGVGSMGLVVCRSWGFLISLMGFVVYAWRRSVVGCR